MALLPSKKRDPWDTMLGLQDEINKLFKSSIFQFPMLKEETFAPLVDTTEDKDNIYVEADIPALNRKI